MYAAREGVYVRAIENCANTPVDLLRNWRPVFIAQLRCRFIRMARSTNAA